MISKASQTLACVVLGSCATTVLADAPFSVDFLAGQASHESDVSSGRELSGDDKSLGIRASYAFNQYAALEMGYEDLGDYEDSFEPNSGTIVTEQIEVAAFKVGLKATVPVTELFMLNARAGAARWALELEETVTGRAEMFSDDDHGIDLYYGVGADLNLGKNWRVSLEYSVLNFDAEIGFGKIDQTVENASLALGYRF